MSAPTQEQLDEAARATELYHTALIALGLQQFKDSVVLYQDVPPIPNASNHPATNKWLVVAVAHVMLKRLKARDLALAFYRYQRALLTGATIALPGHEAVATARLSDLKRDFEILASAGSAASQTPTDAQAASEAGSGAASTVTGADRTIPVEVIDGLDADLAALEKEAEKQVVANLTALGPQNQDFIVRKSKPQTLDDADVARQGAHSDAANRQAASAERNTMNGARGSLYVASEKDKRVLGWVRVSKTGTPCGFCAMLISRGVVYRSAQAAGDQDLYHDNCHCIAVPVFSVAQYESNAMFDLNRKYAVLWPKVTRGLGGDAAISAWRRFIRQEAKSQKSQAAVA